MMIEKGHHEKLDVWHKAIDFCVAIYRGTESFPPSERFGLVSQMIRAAVSVASNIAEGAARGTTNLFVQFLGVARGSLAELGTQLIIAQRLGFINESGYQSLNHDAVVIGKMLSNLVKALKTK
jgi:four helix bundle protein